MSCNPQKQSNRGLLLQSTQARRPPFHSNQISLNQQQLINSIPTAPLYQRQSHQTNNISFPMSESPESVTTQSSNPSESSFSFHTNPPLYPFNMCSFPPSPSPESAITTSPILSSHSSPSPILPQTSQTTTNPLYMWPIPIYPYLTLVSPENIAALCNLSNLQAVNEPNNSVEPVKSSRLSVIDRVSFRGEYRPKYPHRARLNIFIDEKLTKFWFDKFDTKFPNSKDLYYYLDISTAMQMNDNQINQYQGTHGKVMFANYDLCNSNNQTLFAVILPNHRLKENDKWPWKLDCFVTADVIQHCFGLRRDQLPKSSRYETSFYRQLHLDESILNMLIYGDVMNQVNDWSDLAQLKRKLDEEEPVTSLEVTKNQWFNLCQKGYPRPIPIVVNENKNGQNRHWVEWVKLIVIEKKGSNIPSSIGVSCRYDWNKRQWNVRSICLDRSDVENKHRLCNLRNSEHILTIKGWANCFDKITFKER